MFVWRPAGVLITITLIGGVFIIATRSWIGCGVGVVIGTLLSGPLLFFPSDLSAADSESKTRTERSQLSSEITGLQESFDRLKQNYAAKNQEYERAKKQYRDWQFRQSKQYRLQQLLKQDWKAMRGIPFEDFLQEAFEELSYLVETTKTSGDQGVDLIISEGHHRIAIQVKAYVSSVSNSAIQQAHAGMSFYQCDNCAVITNSLFTASAVELAQSVGCILIDEKKLPSLIMGDFDLFSA
jgi:hypothetical protein